MPEKWTVEITNMDSATYKINILHPTLGEMWQTDEIAADASASSFKNAVDGYFWSYFWSSISVTLEYFDAD